MEVVTSPHHQEGSALAGQACPISVKQSIPVVLQYPMHITVPLNFIWPFHELAFHPPRTYFGQSCRFHPPIPVESLHRTGNSTQPEFHPRSRWPALRWGDQGIRLCTYPCHLRRYPSVQKCTPSMDHTNLQCMHLGHRTAPLYLSIVRPRRSRVLCTHFNRHSWYLPLQPSTQRWIE